MALNNIVRTLRFSENEYFPSEQTKTGIALHHTVGGSAHSTFRWWKDDGQIVGTAYLISLDGTIHEVFNPSAWAWQFGLKWPKEKKLKFEKRFIGIEIASEGGLRESGGNLYCFDRIDDRTLKHREEAFDYGRDYRGYRYFDRYEKDQVDSAIALVNDLCTDFSIPKQLPGNYLEYYGDKLAGFEGIIGHVNVRSDKSDPAPDSAFWQRFIDECGLELVDIGNADINILNEQQIIELYDQNVLQFSKMDRDSGNMVKQLLWDLQAHGNSTYIRLSQPAEGGHTVFYEMVQGENQLVKLYAESIGFSAWDNLRLEV